MNILILATELDRCESHMVAELSRRGFKVTAVLGKNRRFSEALQGSSVTIVDHEFKSRVDPGAILLIRRLLRQEQFDIVHCFSARALSSLLIASYGITIKKIAYRGTIGHLSPWDPSSWLSFLNPGLDKIICVSKAVEAYLSSLGIPQEKLVTIYKGHDPIWYEKIPQVALSEFNIPHDSFVISCVANMRPVKGIDILLQAFNLVPENLPIYLLLVGEIRDEKVKDLLEKNSNRSRIICTGFRSDAPGVVASSNVFVMPSLKREGLPKALIEAMSRGIAPIVTDVGGMPEVVRNEIDGLVVPPGDPLTLSKAILRLYKDRGEAAKFAKSSKSRVDTDFHISATIESTFQEYSQLLRNTRGFVASN